MSSSAEGFGLPSGWISPQPALSGLLLSGQGVPSGFIFMSWALSGDITSGIEELLQSGWVSAGPLLSGVVGNPTNLFSGQLASGTAVTTGSITTPYIPYQLQCYKCGRLLPNEAGVHVGGASGLSVNYCWECAGFVYRQGYGIVGFRSHNEHVRDYLLQDHPFTPGTPVLIAADWLEEERDDKRGATFLRQHFSGRVM